MKNLMNMYSIFFPSGWFYSFLCITDFEQFDNDVLVWFSSCFLCLTSLDFLDLWVYKCSLGLDIFGYYFFKYFSLWSFFLHFSSLFRDPSCPYIKPFEVGKSCNIFILLLGLILMDGNTSLWILTVLTFVLHTLFLHHFPSGFSNKVSHVTVLSLTI